MRIFGFEIHKIRQATMDDQRVWHNPPNLPKRIGGMSPNELRDELAKVQEHLMRGGTVHIGPNDPHQRIHFNLHTMETPVSIAKRVNAMKFPPNE